MKLYIKSLYKTSRRWFPELQYLPQLSLEYYFSNRENMEAFGLNNERQQHARNAMLPPVW